MSRTKLVISDLQMPFEHPDALSFCVRVKKENRIADEDVYNVGDELDNYYGGMWDKSPEASHTANQEIDEARSKLRHWYKAFPQMKLCLSNHGTRWLRKAMAAQIPSQMLRGYQEMIQSPKGWRWQKHWKVRDKHSWMIEHGDDWGGQYPHVAAAMHNGMSTAIGHHHSKFGVSYMKTNGLDIWGAAAGSLIDFDLYAFEYARSAKLKPQLGLLLIVDGGRRAIPVRM